MQLVFVVCASALPADSESAKGIFRVFMRFSLQHHYSMFAQDVNEHRVAIDQFRLVGWLHETEPAIQRVGRMCSRSNDRDYWEGTAVTVTLKPEAFILPMVASMLAVPTPIPKA